MQNICSVFMCLRILTVWGTDGEQEKQFQETCIVHKTKSLLGKNTLLDFHGAVKKIYTKLRNACLKINIFFSPIKTRVIKFTALNN